MENGITISTLGSCVSRDIFRVADTEGNFRLKGNVGFISALSINSKPFDNSQAAAAIKEVLRQCDDSNFHKRNKILDLEKGAWAFLAENKSEYLVIDMSDIMYPQLTKDDYSFTCRNTDHNAEIVFKRELMKLGYIFKPVSSYSAAYVIDAVEKMCKEVIKIYDPDKIILLNLYPTNVFMSENGIDRNNMFLRGVYEHGTYWHLMRRVNARARQVLNCMEVQMPPRSLSQHISDIPGAYILIILLTRYTDTFILKSARCLASIRIRLLFIRPKKR